MEDLDVNTIMSVNLQAAVHLGKDYAENLNFIQNHSKRTLKQLFNVTEKLIRDQKDISGIPVINWQQLMWQRTTLLTDKAAQFATAKNLRLFRFSIVYGRCWPQIARWLARGAAQQLGRCCRATVVNIDAVSFIW